MNLSPLPIQKFFDNNGIPLVGGLLFTYVAGTTTKIATYTDSSGGTPNTNPVVLDYRGEANVWLDNTKTYKFVLSPSTDTDPPTHAIWTEDNLTAPIGLVDLTQQVVGKILYPQTAAESSAGVTPVNYYITSHDIDGKVRLLRYATNTTPGITDMYAGLSACLSVVASSENSSGYIELPAGDIYFSQTLAISLTPFDQQLKIVGCGRGVTRLIYSGSGSAITWPTTIMLSMTGFTLDLSAAGSSSKALVGSPWRSFIEDIRLLGPGSATSTIGWDMEGGSGTFDMKSRDIYITLFGTGIKAIGSISGNTAITNFLICGAYVSGNNINYYFDGLTDAAFVGCQSESSVGYGVYLKNTTNFNWLGGAIEASGTYGIYFDTGVSGVFVRVGFYNNTSGDLGGTPTGDINRIYYGGGNALNLQGGSKIVGDGGSGTAPSVSMYSGDPEGSVAADPGSMVLAGTGIDYAKASGTGNTGWRRLGYFTSEASAANLASAAAAINTTDKYRLKTCLNTDTGVMFYAVGSGTTDNWTSFNAGTNITPV